jgi:hypothetical protein
VYVLLLFFFADDDAIESEPMEDAQSTQATVHKTSDTAHKAATGAFSVSSYVKGMLVFML